MKIKLTNSILKKIITICFFSILLFSNAYSQKNEQLTKQGRISKTNYLLEIPFTYINKHIFIEVVISGKKYNFIFDTGCELSVIDPEIAGEIGYKPIKQIEISGSSFTTEKVTLIEISKISISALDFENMFGILQNLSFIKHNYDSIKVHGIIGNNLIRKANWQIDYQKHIIKISDQIDNFNVAKAYPIKLSAKKKGISYIDLTINSKKHPFIFDLGSGGSFTANVSFLKYMSAKNTEVIKPDVYYKAFVEQLKLGEMQIANQTISLQKGVSSLIGNRFFENYLLTIDWRNNKIYLEPHKN